MALGECEMQPGCDGCSRGSTVRSHTRKGTDHGTGHRDQGTRGQGPQPRAPEEGRGGEGTAATFSCSPLSGGSGP